MKMANFKVSISTPSIPEMSTRIPFITQALPVHTNDMVKQIDELASKTALAMESAAWREVAISNSKAKGYDMFDVIATITCVDSGRSETYLLKITSWKYTVYNIPLTKEFPNVLRDLRGIISYLLCDAKYSVK